MALKKYQIGIYGTFQMDESGLTKDDVMKNVYKKIGQMFIDKAEKDDDSIDKFIESGEFKITETI